MEDSESIFKFSLGNGLLKLALVVVVYLWVGRFFLAWVFFDRLIENILVENIQNGLLVFSIRHVELPFFEHALWVFRKRREHDRSDSGDHLDAHVVLDDILDSFIPDQNDGICEDAEDTTKHFGEAKQSCELKVWIVELRRVLQCEVDHGLGGLQFGQKLEMQQEAADDTTQIEWWISGLGITDYAFTRAEFWETRIHFEIFSYQHHYNQQLQN